MDKVAKYLPFISHKGDRVSFCFIDEKPLNNEIVKQNYFSKVTLPEPCDPNKLLPNNPAYWTYFGSLTTPPFSESVIWLVFKEPVEVSKKQLELMRNLRCYDVNEPCPCDGNGKVINNYRPTLPLGNRELREIGGH